MTGSLKAPLEDVVCVLIKQESEDNFTIVKDVM
jgi:hypothetical protein